MIFRFYTTFRFLKIIGGNFEDFDLLPGVTAVRERVKIRKILSKEFKSNSGLIEFNHFYEANHVIYAEFSNELFESHRGSHEALMAWLLWIDMLVYSSWLIKDNCILCEIAYCNKTDKKNLSHWTNNSLMSLHTLADGNRFVDTDFSHDELVKWEEVNNRLQSYLYGNNSTIFVSFLDSKYSRYGRAYNFVKAAKREFNPAMKIAHYCSALESLFSTDSSELSHKLSERIAIFLRDYGYDPIATFDDIKSFYNVRSKVTHGDSLKSSKVEFIPQMSVKLDNYLRTVMNIILDSNDLMEIFNGDKNEFENFFKKKILTVS